ncbi:MAG: fumarate hydratase [Candidatus Omnitrophota bacterium]|nr:MAG: fumarate hydratase [Candidatus Omnitrophota bacterium]
MTNLRLKKEMEELVAKASFCLRADLYLLLKKALAKETKPNARKALRCILENARIANKENLAICQDTGLPVLFIEAGKDVKLSSQFIKILQEGVMSGYKKHSLRASMVDPILRKAPSYKGVISHVEFLEQAKGIKITLFPKGFGSENKSQLKMFNPTASVEEIEGFIVESVKNAGPEGCPPFVVGVGIGGTADKALLLAKKSLIDRVDKSNPDRNLKKLEQSLFKKINNLRIGPMGFGGKTTVLAVKVKTAPTHIAGLPVGVNISCHALRSAAITFK